MNQKSNISDWRLFQFFLVIGLSAGLLYPLLTYNGILEISCPFAHLNEATCPSCGLSMAWHYLYTGHIKAATKTNPYAYNLLLLLLSQIVWRGWLIVKTTKSNPVIIWDIIITTSSFVTLAGPYLIDLFRFTMECYKSVQLLVIGF